MGIGKKAAKHKAKKVVEGVTEDIPVVGDLVDDSIQSGPMDRADDKLDKVGGKKKKGRKLR